MTDLINLDEAAAKLGGISRRTLEREIADGVMIDAARSRRKGGLKIAVLSTAVIGLLSSAGIILR